jgi:Tol biopolymer transport system component
MRFDGSALQVLHVPGVKAARPAWSPDGAKLVFEGLPAGARRRSLYVMNAAGGGVHRLGAGRQPAWSAKNRIAFARNNDLYVIRADGRGLKRLTHRGGGQPNWSPDGQQIAFTRKGFVWRLNVATRRARKLKRGSEPAWTPDGKGVLYVLFDGGNYWIYSVRPSGKGVKLVTGGEEGRRSAVTDPDQQPR